jgi:oligosaccharide translocation protein RFT1
LPQWQKVAQIAWLAVPVGITTAGILGTIWVSLLTRPDTDVYTPAVAAFALSAVIELTAEPLWILGQMQLYIRLKVAAEGLGLTVRCVLTIVLLMKAPDLGLYAFCFAQVAGSVVQTLVYYVVIVRDIHAGELAPLVTATDLLPGADAATGTSWPLALPPDLSERAWNFWKQSLLKQFLTEGEGFLMTFLGVLSFSEQGVYNVINNLGSLIPRFLFAPIEETFFTYFAGLVGQGDGTRAVGRGKVDKAVETLRTLLTFVVLVSLVIAVFAQAYAATALHIYGGDVLSSGTGPLLLRVYAVYVVFLALNGVTESFMFAAMTNVEVDRHNLWMVGFSAVFLGAAWQLTALYGSVGFILANCVNMGVRIGRSAFFIKAFVLKAAGAEKLRQLTDFVPPAAVQAALAAALVVTTFSREVLCCTVLLKVAHIALGAGMLLTVVATVWFTHRSFLMDFLALYRGRRAPPS